MDAYPLLWQYPWNLAARLWRTCSDDPEAVEHVICFVNDVTRRRLLRLSGSRDPHRSRESVCRRALWILGAIAAAHDAGTRWPTMLPKNIDCDGLCRLLARTVAVYHASPRPRHRKQQTPTVTDARHVITSFFRCCISDGVFEPHIPSNARLDEHRLDMAVLHWENVDPSRFRALPPSLELRDRRNMSDTDVKKMLTVWPDLPLPSLWGGGGLRGPLQCP